MKTIITLTNNLTDKIFNDSFYLNAIRVSKFEYVVRTIRFDVYTLLYTLCNIKDLFLLSNKEFNLTHMHIFNIHSHYKSIYQMIRLKKSVC